MLGAKQTVYPDWFKQSFLDFRADIAEAAQAGKTVILLFHQDGCPYCNALVERNLSQRKIEQKLRDKFEIVALNIWGDRDIVSVLRDRVLQKKNLPRRLRCSLPPAFYSLTRKQISRYD